MLTLFIDTHADNILMAFFKEDKLWKKKEFFDSKNHSTLCMPMLQSLFLENHVTLQDISDIVVVIGPGSFTGVRLGVTIAKTLAFVKNIPIRTMTSLELYLDSKFSGDCLSMPEKNGFFVGFLNSQKDGFSEYQYMSKQDYETFKLNHLVLESNAISLSLIHISEPTRRSV